MKIIAFRVRPGNDLKTAIEEKVRDHAIAAGFIVSCVGGLRQACVRMAGATPGKQDIRTFEQDFEIVSLVGTVSMAGSHLHMAFSDAEGVVRGGHLKEGTLIDPTAEIIIGIGEGLEFTREMDDATGFKELVVHERSYMTDDGQPYAS
jgi:uncharacterized protein